MRRHWVACSGDVQEHTAGEEGVIRGRRAGGKPRHLYRRTTVPAPNQRVPQDVRAVKGLRRMIWRWRSCAAGSSVALAMSDRACACGNTERAACGRTVATHSFPTPRPCQTIASPAWSNSVPGTPVLHFCFQTRANYGDLFFSYR